jgi:hypothetical protein
MREAMKRPDGTAFCESLVGASRLAQQLVFVKQRADGIDFRIDPFHLRETRCHDLHRRERPRAEQSSQLHGVDETDLVPRRATCRTAGSFQWTLGAGNHSCRNCEREKLTSVHP